MADQNNSLSCFIVGIGVGVAVGMLLAPRSGEETRQILRAKADEGTDYLKAKADDSRDYVKRRGSELRDSASDLIDRGKDALARQARSALDGCRSRQAGVSRKRRRRSRALSRDERSRIQHVRRGVPLGDHGWCYVVLAELRGRRLCRLLHAAEGKENGEENHPGY